MSSHIRTFLTGLFALLTVLLLTLAPAAGLTDTAIRSAKEGALQTAIYGGSFKDNVLNSATQIMVNDATGVLQDGIGDVKDAQRWGEGSVPGALLHGGVGGLASLAKDGDFAAGFVTSAGAEFTTAFVHGQTGGDQSRTGDIIRKYGNPTLAALTSGGDVNQYSINQGIADSQLKNNYYGQHEANGPEKYEEYARENCQNLSSTECSDKYYEGAFTGVRMILDEVPFVGEGIAGYECWSGPGAGTCAGILVGIIPFGKRGLDIVKEGAEQLRKRGRVTGFIGGVTVVDGKTGTTFRGTVDLRSTLDRIKGGVKSPVGRNDGTTFKNRPLRGETEPELPSQPEGYYTEYVHPTPNVSGPGPQRIVTGAGGEIYYTPDHYSTFIRLDK